MNVGKKIKISLLLAVLVLITGFLDSQGKALDMKQYIIEGWDEMQGLDSPSVRNIAQSADGHLWLATEKGLVRFDGIKFDTYHFDKSHPLLDHINTVFIDDQQRVFCSTVKGLMQFKSGTFVPITKGTGYGNYSIYSMIQDSYRAIWFSDVRGLFCMKDGDVKKIKKIDIGFKIFIRNIYEDRTGLLWLSAGNKGLYYGQEGKFKKYNIPGLKTPSVNVTYEDRQGDLWVGTNRGLVRIANPKNPEAKAKVFTESMGLSHSMVWSVLEDETNNIWVGTERGITRISPGYGDTHQIQTALNDHVVLDLFRDKEKSIWLGTSSFNLKRIRTKSIKTIYKSEGIPAYTSSVYKLKSGKILIGSIIGELFYYHNSVVKQELKLENNLAMGIKSILEDSEKLWLGTVNRGVYSMQGKQVKQITSADGLSSNSVEVIFRYRPDNLWFGTFGGGITIFKNGDFIRFGKDEGLSGQSVFNIFEDSQSNIWIGTDNGLTFLKKGQRSKSDISYFLEKKWVYGIHEDQHGVLWMGTYNSGLYRYKDGEFYNFTTRSGLGSNNIFQIVEDERNFFWFSSSEGIMRVSKKELNDLARTGGKEINCRVFGKSDGMFNTQCTSSANNSILKTGNGELWFSTNRGIAVVDPSRVMINKIPPPIVISEIFINGNPISKSDSGKTFRGINNINFELKSPTFISPGKTILEYKMDGVDRDWRYLKNNKDRNVHYFNLMPGEYTFRVFARNADGVRSINEVTFNFTNRKYFYQTLVFKGAMLILLLVFSVMIYRGVVKYLQNKKLKNKYKNSTLDPDITEKMLKRLKILMEKEKIYKDETLSMNSLSEMLNVSFKFLSQIINEQLKMNYWELISGYRIDEAKKLLLESENERTVIDIAFEVGFNSKEVFNRTFKKHTNKTPRQYRDEN